MKLDEITRLLNFDTRLQESNMKHKVITEKELKEHISKIPDCSHNVDHVHLEDEADSADRLN